MNCMSRILVPVIALIVVGLVATPAGAAGIIDASAVCTAEADGPNFDYTITLTNTSGVGNDPIGTFWFSWVPGADFMATSPLSVTNPTGWKDTITHFPNISSNGFAIQWVENNSAAAIAPGSSLVFKFTSVDTPAQITSNSIFDAGTPVLTSFVYSGTPFQGDSEQFVVSFASVPSLLRCSWASSRSRVRSRGSGSGAGRRADRLVPIPLRGPSLVSKPLISLGIRAASSVFSRTHDTPNHRRGTETTVRPTPSRLVECRLRIDRVPGAGYRRPARPPPTARRQGEGLPPGPSRSRHGGLLPAPPACASTSTRRSILRVRKAMHGDGLS